ncbi:hypothetical protein A3841_05090 [Pontibacter flavimaris]|uniref:Uncharacterized protein n=1 Tax=Pontibacter flavimaris TaxID=1797110 RepID=A0A1Q5P8K6_9BACT|nr:hypothetical protein A3841_05090 [Pontibacter flavimaris]
MANAQAILYSPRQVIAILLHFMLRAEGNYVFIHFKIKQMEFTPLQKLAFLVLRIMGSLISFINNLTS